MSNPLFIAWTVVPLAIVVTVLGLAKVNRPSMFTAALTMAAGALAGTLGRIPFSSILVQDNLAKIRPDLAAESLRYYMGLAGLRLDGPGGRIELAIALIAYFGAVVVLIVAIRRHEVVAIVVAGFAVVAPVIVALATVIVGTFATRYLQPTVFFPPLAISSGLLLLQSVRKQSLPRSQVLRRVRAVGSAALVFWIVAGVVATVSLVQTATKSDESIACAVSWINDRKLPGAGQYWTVRAVKAAISNPRNLLQTDESLAGYSWLTTADDFKVKKIFFTISDAQSPPFEIAREPTSRIKCGRYAIADYGLQPIRVGSAHH